MIFTIDIESGDPRITQKAIAEELEYALATAFDYNSNPRFPKGAEVSFQVSYTPDEATSPFPPCAECGSTSLRCGCD